MRLINVILLIFLVVSCKKDDCTPPEDNSNALEKGFLVLNEGLFQQNNASLTFVSQNNPTIQNQLFLNTNGRLLGDTGNDMKEYQDKIYIVVNASSTLEVVDKLTLKSVAQILLQFQGNPVSPRAIDFYNNTGYVCAFDGYVYVIDLSSYQITGRFQAGSNPEDVLVVNNQLFVSNSGGLNAPNYDSTVMVFDLIFQVLTKTITVGANPGKMIADAQGDVYVIKRGNYNSDPSELVLLNAQNNYNATALGIAATSLAIENNQLYVGFYDFDNASSSVSIFNTSTGSMLTPNFIENSSISTLYGMAVKNGVLYCMDARGFTNTGVVREFTDLGEETGTWEVGLNPNSIIFYD